MLLFAYASNMNVDKFKETVPSAKKIANAKLPGYQFGFSLTADDGSSKASLTPSVELGAATWGVLIKFNDDEKDNIIFKQDWFKMETVNCVDPDGELYQAEAFVAQPHALNDFLLPYDWYHTKIVKYATDQGLPTDYIAALKLMPCKVDPDEKRRERRLAKI